MLKEKSLQSVPIVLLLIILITLFVLVNCLRFDDWAPTKSIDQKIEASSVLTV